MVGVPGRSKACQPCKKRRVACDQQQPKCSQCSKRKQDCIYHLGCIFVLAEAGSHKTVYKKSDSQVHVNDVAIKPQHRANGKHDSAGLNVRSQTSAELQVARLARTPTQGYAIQQALVATAISEGQSSSSYTLPSMLAKSLQLDAPGYMYAAPLACFAAWRGRRDGNATLISASHQLYIRALRETQVALYDPQIVLADSTLAACNALGLFEALECPDRSISGYQWHRDACCRLVQLRGPAAHVDGFGHILFLSIRPFGILEAVEQARPNFLSDPEWMTIPWLSNVKAPMDVLVDTLTRGPAILRKARHLEAGLTSARPEDTLARMLEIVYDMSCVLYELDVFYEDYEQTTQVPQCWETDSFEQESPDLVFQPVLHFADLGAATTLTLYWAVLAMAWVSLADLLNGCMQAGMQDLFFSTFHAQREELNNLRRPLATYEDMTMEVLRDHWLDNARKVLGSVAYCTTESSIESGPPRVATALSMIIDILKGRLGATHEYRWAVRARQAIGEKWLRLAKFQI